MLSVSRILAVYNTRAPIPTGIVQRMSALPTTQRREPAITPNQAGLHPVSTGVQFSFPHEPSGSCHMDLGGNDLLVIKANPSDVAPFIDTVRTHADRERDALGFLPSAVYDDAASRGNLLVAL